MNPSSAPYQPRNHIRVVTAASLFDGHDAAINIMRRILQASGTEVIHLGHNRSVSEIVTAAVQEDAQAIGVSSYQGGHMEFFKYIVDLLREYDCSTIKVFGGGGGVIVPEEIAELEAYGVTKIFSPEDGRKFGLQGMINQFVERSDYEVANAHMGRDLSLLTPNDWKIIAKLISTVEVAKESGNSGLSALRSDLQEKFADRKIPVLGITGTGGAGKSSLTDEITLRFLNDQPGKTVGIISVDPTRRKTGGALLGDRIRMNSIHTDRVYYRSMATRSQGMEVPSHMEESIEVLKAAGFDLIIVETAGIGQGDAAIVPLVDVSLYVMTSEFGAQSQLEKIDMLDFADLIAINKFDRQGSEDALHDVRKQVQRNSLRFDIPLDDLSVYGTIASRFNDDGVTSLYVGIIDAINNRTGLGWKTSMTGRADKKPSSRTIIIPSERSGYLSEIANTVRRYHAWGAEQEVLIRRLWRLDGVEKEFRMDNVNDESEGLSKIKELQEEIEKKLDPRALRLVGEWEDIKDAYSGDDYVFTVRDRKLPVKLKTRTLSGTILPRIALPKYEDPGQLLRWRLKENLPGMFPFTAGVFPFKRQDEDPTRMFAGEGDPFRTNTRFKYLSANSVAKRLSTAFDSVTLYGQDPEERPDIYGKIGTSGVSICTLDDVKVLYSGFDLSAPNTSVSMTINGPAPIMLAMFFNAAIDQKLGQIEQETGAVPTPEVVVSKIKAEVLSNVRGTVQADILKEDQGQNSCIFSTDFSLRMMGDIQDYFIRNNVRNFYSVSISGYHIAEAGANPITQLAFTLANGFTYVEYYLSRGMKIDDFAPNLSFFFSNGLEPEYSVIGRVARRIWAIAIRDKYMGNERSQKLKYHIQTSGRSLHAQDIQFNDIRTTLQALIAIYDNCNSLHTNSYDEAITTPSEESVRRALAIQLIINKEWGISRVDNINQGSFIIEELTDLVEEAVLTEFDRLSQRGGVLGAMETGYQRTKIQDESLHYETLKSTGDYPIIGVNTFLNPDSYTEQCGIELARGTEEEKKSQLTRLDEFKDRNKDLSGQAMERLQGVSQSDGNVFEELMETVKYCSLGEITRTLYKAGGQYRRNM